MTLEEMCRKCGEYHTKMMKEATGLADKIYHWICQEMAYQWVNIHNLQLTLAL